MKKIPGGLSVKETINKKDRITPLIKSASLDTYRQAQESGRKAAFFEYNKCLLQVQPLELKIKSMLILHLLLISITKCAIVSSVRYADFIKIISITPSLDSLILTFTGLNSTYTLSLIHNTGLATAGSTFTLITDEAPVVKTLLHNAYKEDKPGDWSRITFHSKQVYKITQSYYDTSTRARIFRIV